VHNVRRLTRMASYARSALGVQRFVEARKRRSFVLIYHGFTLCRSCRLPEEYTVDLGTFKRHVTHLMRTHQPASITHVALRLERGFPPRKPVFCVVFDDALVGQVELAIPLCKELGIPVTVSVPVGYLDTGRPIWTTELTAIVALLWTKPAIPLPRTQRPVPTRTAHERDSALKAIRNTLVTENDPENIHEYVEFLRRQIDSTRYAEFLSEFRHLTVVDWQMLESCVGDHVSFATHGWSHGPLKTNWPDSTWLRETLESRQTLERRLGIQVCGFALPNGVTVANAERHLKAAGYRYCMGSQRGFLDGHTDVWAIPRIDAEYPLAVLRRHLTR